MFLKINARFCVQAGRWRIVLLLGRYIPSSLGLAKENVLDFVTAAAYRTRFQAYLDFDGNTNYMEYVTKLQLPKSSAELYKKITSKRHVHY